MNETTTKRRIWIRNIIIIFLAVLLVLTLFSGTILNHSLPEVAVQYPQYGTISSRIRATASISANENYQVTIAQSRVIASVETRVGATVEKGDVLFTLEEGDSTEIDEAKQQLSALQIQLLQKQMQNPALSGDENSAYAELVTQLNGVKSDLSDAKADLALLEEELDEIVARQNTVPTVDQVSEAKVLIASQQNAVEVLEREIERLGGKQGQIGGNGYYTAEEISAMLSDAQAALRTANSKLTAAALAYENAAGTYSGWANRITAAQTSLTNAEEALSRYNTAYPGDSSALEAYQSALQTVSKLETTLSDLQAELTKFRESADLQSALESAKQSVSLLTEEVSYYEEQIADLKKVRDTMLDGASQDEKEQIRTLYEAKIADMETKLGESKLAKQSAEATLTEAQNALDTYYIQQNFYPQYATELEYSRAISETQSALTAAKTAAAEAKTAYEQNSAADSIRYQLQAAVNAAQSELETAEKMAEAAKKEMDTKQSDYENAKTAVANAETEVDRIAGYQNYDELSEEIRDLTKQKEEMEAEIAEAQKLVDSASDENVRALLAEVNAKTKEITAQNKLIASYQTNILNLNQQIADAQKQADYATETDRLEAEQYAIELKQIEDEIEKQTAAIERLENNRVNGTVTAPVSGVIASIEISAGQTAQANTPILTLTLADRGYSMECTVTAEQAATVKVGDTAEIQGYYWGSTPVARVTGIRSDASSQGKNRILTLEVTGDNVSAGTQLTFTLGAKNASYENVIPNSAVREDKDGKFVLIVSARSTPLGNRYTARRVDVEVIASDDTNSAVSGAISGEYVITTSAEPISSGMQVRLRENS